MLCIGVIGGDGWGWAGNEQGRGASRRRRSAGSSCNVLVPGRLGWGWGQASNRNEASGNSGIRPWKAAGERTDR